MALALVTGATGLVGSHLVARLTSDGWRVRALVRDPAGAAWLSPLGAELHTGDVLDPATLISGAAGCDAIFHTAAAITPRGGWSAFQVPNVQGTRNVIDAAAHSGARLSHLSSVAVYGPGARYRSQGPTGEDAPLGALPDAALYARSKRESEALVLDAHRAGHIWATAIRPCVIYGTRDRQFVPRIARALRLGVAPVLGDGSSTLSVVHAANVADAAVRAVRTAAAGGKAYNAANDFDVSVADFFRLAALGLGRRVRLVRIPIVVASVAARLAGVVAELGGRRGSGVMARAAVDFLARDNPFTSELARREIGWSPTVRPEEGIPAAFAWAARP